jgi:hypothetical protein
LFSKADEDHLYPQAKNTGDDAALQFLVNKYHECRDNHSICRSGMPTLEFQPSRLIDVGNGGDALVYLCENTVGEYVTLSHCWGTVQPFTLTKRTSAELLRGISISRLPKTFRDAIEVTRKTGLRYIWIDSL